VDVKVNERDNLSILTYKIDYSIVPGAREGDCCYKSDFIWRYSVEKEGKMVPRICRLSATYCLDKEGKKDPLLLSLPDPECTE
jgi:hypothetical protein